MFKCLKQSLHSNYQGTGQTHRHTHTRTQPFIVQDIDVYKPFAVYFNVEIVIEPLFVVLTALRQCHLCSKTNILTSIVQPLIPYHPLYTYLRSVGIIMQLLIFLSLHFLSRIPRQTDRFMITSRKLRQTISHLQSMQI